ncbi:MAG: alcohol dehydrogenase catalytic domain-containing protein [Legionellales bacterium]|nr:alcohol dehydrogenase catalytic domain-containing protein [Legionellales bacterium]
MKTRSYVGFSADSPLKFYEFNRRELGEHDVHIKIKYCGICHSDIHTVRNEWGGAVYPLVPGHEIVGVVEKVGAKVTRYQPGATVGVGCMVGISPQPHPVSSKSLIFKQKNLSGSLIGGIAETQEMLNYCGKHQIECDIEIIPIQKINEAYERVMRGDVQYRFVIDMQSLQDDHLPV